MRNYTFIHPDPELKNNLMAFGFECGEGWYPLIFELFDKVQDLIDKTSEYAILEVVQVKEKWGSLRVYWNFYYKEIEDLTKIYEDESFKVCEKCGSKENVTMHVIHGWYTTICDGCYNKREK
jgi:hypothetical protein